MEARREIAWLPVVRWTRTVYDTSQNTPSHLDEKVDDNQAAGSSYRNATSLQYRRRVTVKADQARCKAVSVSGTPKRSSLEGDLGNRVWLLLLTRTHIVAESSIPYSWPSR